jgi:putative glutathione S-transferase
MLVDGKWAANWQPVQKADEKGRFVRQTSRFRNWITPDGSAGPTGEGGFKAATGFTLP